MDWPLLHSADGIVLSTYTDSLHDEDEDFCVPCEFCGAGRSGRAVSQMWRREHSFTWRWSESLHHARQ